MHNPGEIAPRECFRLFEKVSANSAVVPYKRALAPVRRSSESEGGSNPALCLRCYGLLRFARNDRKNMRPRSRGAISPGLCISLSLFWEATGSPKVIPRILRI